MKNETNDGAQKDTRNSEAQSQEARSANTDQSQDNSGVEKSKVGLRAEDVITDRQRSELITDEMTRTQLKNKDAAASAEPVIHAVKASKNGETLRTTFTKTSWEALDGDKGGWKADVKTPPEVEALEKRKADAANKK